jgi:hypothetical protein
MSVLLHCAAPTGLVTFPTLPRPHGLGSIILPLRGLFTSDFGVYFLLKRERKMFDKAKDAGLSDPKPARAELLSPPRPGSPANTLLVCWGGKRWEKVRRSSKPRFSGATRPGQL